MAEAAAAPPAVDSGLAKMQDVLQQLSRVSRQVEQIEVLADGLWGSFAPDDGEEASPWGGSLSGSQWGTSTPLRVPSSTLSTLSGGGGGGGGVGGGGGRSYSQRPSFNNSSLDAVPLGTLSQPPMLPAPTPPAPSLAPPPSSSSSSLQQQLAMPPPPPPPQQQQQPQPPRSPSASSVQSSESSPLATLARPAALTLPRNTASTPPSPDAASAPAQGAAAVAAAVAATAAAVSSSAAADNGGSPPKPKAKKKRGKPPPPALNVSAVECMDSTPVVKVGAGGVAQTPPTAVAAASGAAAAAAKPPLAESSRNGAGVDLETVKDWHVTSSPPGMFPTASSASSFLSLEPSSSFSGGGGACDASAPGCSGSSPRMTTPPGNARAAKYKIKQELGRGAFASVYKAESGGKNFAIKKLAMLQRNMGKTITQELEWAMRKPNHPAIIHIYEAFYVDDSGEVWIVQELMNCKSLQHTLDMAKGIRRDAACSTVDESVVAGVSYQLFSALRHLHTQKEVYLHRDIKPDNILMGHKGEVKLGDFGAARCAGSMGIASTYAAGSEAYMSPERAKAEKYGAPSDVFSAGLVLLELVTFEAPSIDGDFFQKVQWKERLASNYLFGAHVSDGLQRFVRSALRALPAERATSNDLLSHPFMTQHCTSIDLARKHVERWLRSVSKHRKAHVAKQREEQERALSAV
eukprot:Rhum_TRINITY_DN11447_c0_g2::Rhum_TRINITY_DN11447_c0_g2_i1::g.44705::m.44705